MPFTDKYDYEEIDYGTEGWNGIQTTNNEITDDNLHTRLLGTLGETVAAYKTVYLASDGKYYKALSNKSKQPALGVTIEAGVLDDEVRIQRIGPITNGSWTWAVPKPVYLDGTTPGELTQTPPFIGTQFMGIPSTATTIILNGTVSVNSLASTTTSSSTTTTTS